MSEDCRRIVRQVFRALDDQASGVISADNMTKYFQANFVGGDSRGVSTVDRGHQDFFGAVQAFIKHGKITRLAFEEFYSEVRAAHNSDDEFISLVKGTWQNVLDEQARDERKAPEAPYGTLCSADQPTSTRSSPWTVSIGTWSSAGTPTESTSGENDVRWFCR